MATPTSAELITQLQNIVHWYETLRETAETNAQNLVAQQDTLVQSLEGDNAQGIATAVAASRAAVSTALSARAALDAHLRDWARFLDIPETDADAILDRMYQYFIDNSMRIVSRGFTSGSPSANASNVGTGTIRRLTVDWQSIPLQAGVPQAYVAECRQDANSGVEKGKEVFEFRTSDAAADNLESLGTGRTATVSASHPDDSLLLNASFDELAGTSAAPISIPSWTSSITVDSTNYELHASSGTTYLPAPDDTTTIRSLEVKNSGTLTQELNVRRTALDPRLAYYCQLAYNATVGPASADGTLTLRMGAQSASATVLNTQGWTVLRVPSSEGQANWFRNFNEDDLDINVVWAPTAGSGSIFVDDIIFVPFTFFDGTGYVVAPAQTPFLARSSSRPFGDSFSWTDTATEAVIQRWLARSYGRYLPHTASGATIADP